MGLRDRLRRLRRASEDVAVSIPQPNGPPARFPESELQAAFLTTLERLKGEDVPPHALSLAASRSPSPEWNRSLYADDGGEVIPVEDLSE